MSRTILYLLLGTTITLTGCQINWTNQKINDPDEQVICTADAKICLDGSAVGRSGPNCEFKLCPNEVLPPVTKLIEPIADFKNRITKKPFGIFITPENSPVQPEKFTGYHTGVDIEYQDIKEDVSVYAITDGTMIYAGIASGYGGVLAIKHTIDGQEYTAIYGHLDPQTLVKNNQTIKAGEKIGLLGDGYTDETAGERKHLHFSIHLGSSLNLTGYVKTKLELQNWIDPLELYNI